MDATPVQRLLLRVHQIDAPTGDPPVQGSVALYRLVEGGMPICAKHLSELGVYQDSVEARAVLTLDQIDALVVEFGLRRDDLMSSHGPTDPTFGEERCRICESTFAEGNLCHNDDCQKPLHPEWPAVYCSHACALSDL